MVRRKNNARRKSFVAWLKSVLEGVFENLFGKRGSRSVFSILVISCITVAATSAMPLVVNMVTEVYRERQVHAMQDRLSSIERLPTSSLIVKPVSYSPARRELHYLDPTTRQKVVADLWENGHLVCRTYYDRGQLISRDFFLYDQGTQSGKKREYFENGVKVMVEEFSQTGLLLVKHQCKKTDPSNCRDYIRDDDYRSPLPPAGYVFYR
jgi:hypothetical protein